MSTKFLRAAAASTVTAAVLLGASGCFMLPTSGSDSDAGETPPATAEPSEPIDQVETEEPADPDTGGDFPSTLSFEDGANITATQVAQWGDGLIADDGWTISSPDDGQGSWTYATVDGACTAKFYQGLVFDMNEADDLAASDFMLAAMLQSDVATVQGFATDATTGYLSRDNSTTELRQVQGGDASRSWVMSVRGFATKQAALYVIVDCQNDQAATVSQEVLSKMSVVLLPG